MDPEKDQWIWADDPDFPLNDATIREICTLLTDLTPQQTLAAEEPLDSYELDQPSASLEAARADGTSLSLSFGKATTDGTSYYALMNGDESTVYIFDGALVKKMDVAIYDMMDLPVLPGAHRHQSGLHHHWRRRIHHPDRSAAEGRRRGAGRLALRRRQRHRRLRRPGHFGGTGAADADQVRGLQPLSRGGDHLRV